MNWNNGFTARYHLRIVDAATWRDTETCEITGGSIRRTVGELMEAADIDMTRTPAAREAWVRLWLDASQEDNGAHEPLFTGLMIVPSVDWNGNRRSCRAECYSVLKPAADVLLDRGWYAPAGENGARIAAGLLNIGAAPVTYEEYAPALQNSIVAEDGESFLSMARKIIEAIGWRIRISGDGTIRICPIATGADVYFDALENDCIETQIRDENNWYACPNVFRAIAEDLAAVARDDDPESALSTVARGREVWMEEKSCVLNAGESIAEYALRRLREEQAPARTISYVRRYRPDLTVGDIVHIHHPAQNIEGNYRITSQQIELGYAAKTTEEAVMI